MQKDFKSESIKKLRGVIICSSQASIGEPLCDPSHIVAMALSAIAGGARALRLEGSENIAAARQDRRVPADCPIVGLIKDETVPPEKRLHIPYITNSFEAAQEISSSGADIIALDATRRERKDGLTLAETVGKIHKILNKPVWADVATIEEGMQAIEDGCDIVSTTLFGYTAETAAPSDQGPNFDFLAQLIKVSPVPVILEGRVWHPAEVTKAFEMGAYAVVVGSAITRPQLIAERFVKAIPDAVHRSDPSQSSVKTSG